MPDALLYYKVEKWAKEGSVARMLYAGSALATATIFASESGISRASS